jgi:hypothetical protein
VGLERGPLSLARINEEILERKSSGFPVENVGSVYGRLVFLYNTIAFI